MNIVFNTVLQGLCQTLLFFYAVFTLKVVTGKNSKKK